MNDRAPSVDATRGELVLPPAADGHRVYLGGRLVAAVSARVAVSCGREHVVKIGSRGREPHVVPPCGADLFIPFL